MIPSFKMSNIFVLYYYQVIGLAKSQFLKF